MLGHVLSEAAGLAVGEAYYRSLVITAGTEKGLNHTDSCRGKLNHYCMC